VFLSSSRSCPEQELPVPGVEPFDLYGRFYQKKIEAKGYFIDCKDLIGKPEHKV
jgi:hypothetical protein